MPSPPKRRPSDEILERVIREKAGIVSHVARALGVTPRAVQMWKKNNKKINRMFQSVRDEVLDLAESKLLQNIRAGKTAEIIFYLKCMGKSRGYVERQEITGADGDPLISQDAIARRTVELVKKGLRDDEVRRLYAELQEKIDGTMNRGRLPS